MPDNEVDDGVFLLPPPLSLTGLVARRCGVTSLSGSLLTGVADAEVTVDDAEHDG